MDIKTFFLRFIYSPYSGWGLRHRASRLQKGTPYRRLLEVLSKARDKGVISEDITKLIVGIARDGKLKEAIGIFEKQVDLFEQEHPERIKEEK